MENNIIQQFNWNGTIIQVSRPVDGLVTVQSATHSMVMDKHAFDQMIINKEIMEVRNGTGRN